jgi:hypothetical protein
MPAPSVRGFSGPTIYGGFIAPWESGYEQNINLFTKLPCSPCWLREPCPYDKKCMKQITVDEVFGEVCTHFGSKI